MTKVEATGLENVASRSSSMASPLYTIPSKFTNRFRTYGGKQAVREADDLTSLLSIFGKKAKIVHTCSYIVTKHLKIHFWTLFLIAGKIIF
jgi:hypothetical protein